LFVATWVFSDDYGRHPLSFKRLKMEAFPGDSLSVNDVAAMFGELWQARLVTVYQCGSDQYFSVNGWHHQKIDKPQKPRYPSPSEGDVVPFSVEFVEHSTNGSDYSPNVRSRRDTRDTRDRKDTTSTVPTSVGTTDAEVKSQAYHPEFESFWAVYPKRGGRLRGKQKTFLLWKREVSASDRASLVTAATNFSASDEVRRGYARDPERFIAAGWWRDWLEAEQSSPTKSRVLQPEDYATWNPVDGGNSDGES
jgi:hypothetical protein